MEAVKVIVAWGAFALFHSLTVSERYERWARHAMGEERFGACHRFLFTAYSAAATAAALLYVRSLPDLPLYRLDGWVRLLFHGVQFLGAGLLLWTPWDPKEFVGPRQRNARPGGGGDAGPDGPRGGAARRDPYHRVLEVRRALAPGPGGELPRRRRLRDGPLL